MEFSTLNFPRLWRGRERTTQVERALLGLALGPGRSLRCLEVGTGEGRVSPVVQDRGREYVAVDLTPTFVDRVEDRPGTATVRVVADVRCLPFAAASFDRAAMFRVYNFLEDPRKALRELSRVLRPGGLLAVSYFPKPSLATLVDDAKMILHSPSPPSFRPMTFSKRDRVPVQPSALPSWAPTRRTFARELAETGFLVELELPCGLEDYRLFRLAPTPVFVGLARALSRCGGFPQRIVRARRIEDTHPQELGALSQEGLWVCPACRRPLEVEEGSLPGVRPCPEHGAPKVRPNGVVDARLPSR